MTFPKYVATQFEERAENSVKDSFHCGDNYGEGI